MQGVIKSYDPGTAEGVVMRDTDRSGSDLPPQAPPGPGFRLPRRRRDCRSYGNLKPRAISSATSAKAANPAKVPCAKNTKTALWARRNAGMH